MDFVLHREETAAIIYASVLTLDFFSTHRHPAHPASVPMSHPSESQAPWSKARKRRYHINTCTSQYRKGDLNVHHDSNKHQFNAEAQFLSMSPRVDHMLLLIVVIGISPSTYVLWLWVRGKQAQ